MLSSFFIERPSLSSVISIVITLAGIVSIFLLPIEQFPNILPPQINVQTQYAGANADVVANTVASPLEQQINAVENMIYMYSNSSSTGNYNLNVVFDIGYNINQALIDVENQANIAMPLLPKEVQHSGVTILKQTPAILMVVAVQSPDGRYDEIFLSNYSTVNIVQELQRTPGVSNVTIINDRTYAMRIWLDPALLVKYGLTTGDVMDAVMDQNSEYSVGRLGSNPTEGPIELTVSMTTTGRLTTPEEFDNIIIKANEDGSIVYVKDVGFTELGAQNYDVDSTINGQPAISIAIYQQFGSNALALADLIRQKMETISKQFPKGIEYSIPYDTTKFVKASIKEVVITLLQAAGLVALVVLIFLQNIRITIIPVIAMVVSIIGTFAGMLALGVSINTLTLFAMVLAVGIVVDDAIVVIENVERNMRLYKFSAKEAAHRAMEEVTAPIIAIVLVLCSVFIPVAFLGGIAGQLYKQFALTIAISVIISGIVALTLSPALSALLLKPQHTPSKFTILFDRFFDQFTALYTKGVRWLIVREKLGMAFFLGVCCMVGFLFHIIPTAFIPNEDQGYLINVVSMPEGSSLLRTTAVTNDVEEITMKNPATETFLALSGFSYIDNLNRTNIATNFIILKNWDERTERDEHADAVLRELLKKYHQIPQAPVLLFNPPAIQGLGTVGGFEFWVENRGSGDYAHLQTTVEQLMAKIRERPELINVSTTINANAEQLYVDLDREKARTLNVPVREVYSALQTLFGSYFVDNFNKFGRVYQVMLMAQPKWRMKPTDINLIYVKSKTGEMVPLTSIVTLRNVTGANLVSRFNTFPAAKINGSAAPGYSSGQAMLVMEELAKEILPDDMNYSWAGESYQEKASGGSSSQMMFGGLIMVFLILVGLYERWSLPLSIIMAVPFGIFGALSLIFLTRMNNDVYFQIGLITIIALSAKNAILIVEFAMIKSQEGMSFLEAAVEAGRLRFRAILMTSLTFIFGVLPLVFSTGAGANSRHSVGMGVLGGMISATFLAIFFVPLFFKIIVEWSEKKGANPPEKGAPHA